MRFKSLRNPFILFVTVFIFLSIYTTNANINGDGFRNAFWAQQIAESGLLDYEPYRIVDINENGYFYTLISYPLTSHVVMAIFYIIGGRLALHFFSPFFGALSSVFIYLLLKKVNEYVGLISGFVAILLNYYVFIKIFPVPEEFLLMVMMACLYFYNQFLNSQKREFALLTGFFIGLASSTKQQGIIFSVAILLHGLIWVISKKRKDRGIWKLFTIIIMVAILMSAVPFIDQIRRNGTLGHAEDPSFPPFLESKASRYLESYDLMIEKIGTGYWPRGQSLLDVIEKYLLYPIYFSEFTYPTRSLSIPVQIGLMCITLIPFILGLYSIRKKDASLFSILIFLFIIEIALPTILSTPIPHYHVLGLAIYALFFVTGIFSTGESIYVFIRRKLTRFRISSKQFLTLFVIAILLLVQSFFVTTIHWTVYGDSGRYDHEHLQAYENIAKYVGGLELDNKVMFLTGSEGFNQFSERDIIWFDGLNSNPTLYYIISNYFNISDTLVRLNDLNQYLQKYDRKIGYIFVETRLIGERTGDGWPKPDFPKLGLVDFLLTKNQTQSITGEILEDKYVDSPKTLQWIKQWSGHFDEIYSIPLSKGSFYLFKINY